MLTRLHSATPVLRVVTAIAFLVGVFVWPTPKEALAVNTVFRVNIDWEFMEYQDNIDPDLITITLRTYSDATHETLIEEAEIPFFFQENEVNSRFELSILLNPNGIYWDILIEIDATAAFQMVEGNPVDCGTIDHGNLNVPPIGIHMAD